MMGIKIKGYFRNDNALNKIAELKTLLENAKSVSEYYREKSAEKDKEIEKLNSVISKTRRNMDEAIKNRDENIEYLNGKAEYFKEKCSNLEKTLAEIQTDLTYKDEIIKSQRDILQAQASQNKTTICAEYLKSVIDNLHIANDNIDEIRRLLL